MVDAKDAKLATPISMDTSLDDIEDLPQFIVPLSGAYQMTLENIEQKEINDKGCFSCNFVIDEVMELSESPDESSGESVPKQGDKFNIPYFNDNKFSAGLFKSDILLPLAKQFGVKTVGEVVNQAKDLKVLVVMKRTYDKDKDRHYPKLKKLQLL